MCAVLEVHFLEELCYHVQVKRVEVSKEKKLLVCL